MKGHCYHIHALSSLSHQTLLICGARLLLELLLVLASFVPLERSRVTPESPGKKKKEVLFPHKIFVFLEATCLNLLKRKLLQCCNLHTDILNGQ